MELIIRNYGKTVYELLVVGLILTYLLSTVTDEEGNQGILHIIGAKMQTEEINDQDYTDFSVYAEERAKEAPKIVYDASVTMQTGVNKITNHIKAFDYAGKELTLKVRSIKNPYDVELIDRYNQDTAEIELSQPGIYIMELSAADDVNQKSVSQIRIPVNQSQGGH